MLDIFKLEWRTLWRGAAVAALVHFIVLYYLGRSTDLLQHGGDSFRMIAVAYALAGSAFGTYRFSGSQEGSTWIYLLHRPLHPVRICLSVIGAAATMLFLAIALPAYLLITFQDWWTDRLVDSRHYLLPLPNVAIGLAAYLVATYLMLIRQASAPGELQAKFHPFGRGSFPKFIALQLIIIGWISPLIVGSLREGADVGAIILLLAADALLAVAVLMAFTANPHRAAGRNLRRALVSVPLQMALYFALFWIVDGGYRMFWTASGTHPLRRLAPAGSYVEATRSGPASVIMSLLPERPEPLGPPTRERVAIASIQLLIPRFPEFGEMINSGPAQFDDQRRGVSWTFSHDSRRFQGRRLNDDSAFGTLALPGDPAALDRPPLYLGAGQLTDGRRLMAFSDASGQIDTLFTLPAVERILAPSRMIGRARVVLSDRAVYIEQPVGRVRKSPGSATRVPLPGPAGGLQRVDIAAVATGYLVSFTFGRQTRAGLGTAYQKLVHVSLGGATTYLARRDLKQDYSAFFRLRAWWISPAFFHLERELYRRMRSSEPGAELPLSPVPRPVLIVAILLCLLSMALVYRQGRRWRLHRIVHRGWSVAALVGGLPVLFAFLLLYELSEEPEPAEA